MQHEAQLKAAYVGEGDINEPNCYNYSSYFKHIEPLYSKADIVAANIETNFAPPPYSGYPTFCSPSSLVKQIVESGFNLLFTANNHILDRGRVGVESTIELYQQLGVDYIGVYRNSAEAATNHPLIVEKGEFRVAFLNYTYGTNGVPIPKPFVVNTLDSVRIKRELKELRKLKELRDPIERVDLIIASFHWGEEYVTTPSKEQLIWEKFLYRNGVDIIIGHHPHVPQPVKV